MAVAALAGVGLLLIAVALGMVASATPLDRAGDRATDSGGGVDERRAEPGAGPPIVVEVVETTLPPSPTSTTVSPDPGG